ncbi:hypothetical protein HOI71_03135 [Candidatus Poribacteria bacterium]|jgi:CRISPR/Cas system CSM-associated protein Csm3 (group 7 of RAMP superfamily)|nr:hypothetical protein [Candidatus Poribacteria bacterium]MBT7806158.1 hypothetical protein [Candidatus Poribacteria bacterium]
MSARAASHIHRNRAIRTRIVVKGTLVAETPLHLGAGDAGDVALDLALLRDPTTRRPLLTGATLAGAMRAYLDAHGLGCEGKLLFGGKRGEEGGDQSPLVVDDAVAVDAPAAELRDGVGLDSRSKTATDGALYGMELWAAGTKFPVVFELSLESPHDAKDRRKDALHTALGALTRGEISVGLKKTRGYGRLRLETDAEPVEVCVYDLASSDGLMKWLCACRQPSKGSKWSKAESDSLSSLDDLGELLPSRRPSFSISGRFALDAPLLIRGRSDGSGVDAAHLRARGVDGVVRPALSGTSLAGALRARARRVLHALHKDLTPKAREDVVDGMFGRDARRDENGLLHSPLASRLVVGENYVSNGTTDLYQNRIRIDRFTAGVVDSALFDENPVYPKDDGSTSVPIVLRLRDPQPHEIGLLLHLVKDLWTGDLPVGGTTSVGRGSLLGKHVTLNYTGGDSPLNGVIKREGKGAGVTLDGLAAEQLNCYSEALATWVEAGE